MDASVTNRRARSRIAILALGGEGGGVLADWIVDLAEHGGYLAQTTSVPGVAQRTGATIYYVELFPKLAAQAAGREPVLSLMPMPGDVEIVLASELMEAARAVERGFVTPDRTLLIASTHRVFAMTEKIALADGRVDEAALLAACRDAARALVAFDMAGIAEATGSVLSAVLFGALAGSGALPFQRMAFEAAIRRGGVGVKASIAAFGAGFEAAQAGEQAVATPAVAPPTIAAGIERLTDYQDAAYADDYLARLAPLRDIEQRYGDGSGRLLDETARQLALGMAYEDTIRVAELKIRAEPLRARARGGEGRGRPDSRNRGVLSPAHAGDRRHAAGGARPLAHAHRLGARAGRSLHPQGADRQDHVDRRLRAALSAGEPQARGGAARCASPPSRRR